MFKINKKELNKEEWFEFEEGFNVKLRSPKFSDLNISLNAGEIMDVNSVIKSQFINCITDWKGLEDSENNILECNDENKNLVYDYVDDIRDFILGKITSMKK